MALYLADSSADELKPIAKNMPSQWLSKDIQISAPYSIIIGVREN
jgi:hypothetical protein